MRLFTAVLLATALAGAAALAQVGQVPAWPPTQFVGGGSPAFTFVASTGLQTISVSTTNPAIDTTGATCIIITISGFGTLSGLPTDTQGNTYTAGPDGNSTTTSGTNVAMYYKSAPSNSASMQFGGNAFGSNFASMAVAAFTSSAGCILDVHGATNNSNTPGSLTPAGNGELFVTGFVAKDADAATPTVGSSFVIPTKNAWAFSSGNNESGGQAYFLQGTAGALNPAWAATGGNSGAAQMLVFK